MRIWNRDSSGKLNTVCVDCGKKISMGSKRCRACFGKYKSYIQQGSNNPCYRNGKSENFGNNFCIDCGIKVWRKGTRCEKCYGKSILGEKSHLWKNGASFEPYAPGWGEKLKEQIRNRDNNKCRECGTPQLECVNKLHVHHIDYDKKNNNENNLISLCPRCHNKLKMRPSWAEPKYKALVVAEKGNT